MTPTEKITFGGLIVSAIVSLVSIVYTWWWSSKINTDLESHKTALAIYKEDRAQLISMRQDLVRAFPSKSKLTLEGRILETATGANYPREYYDPEPYLIEVRILVVGLPKIRPDIVRAFLDELAQSLRVEVKESELMKVRNLVVTPAPDREELNKVLLNVAPIYEAFLQEVDKEISELDEMLYGKKRA